MPPLSSASTVAQTRCGFTRDTVTPILPRFAVIEVVVSLLHVSPPSVDLYRALPGPVLEMSHGVRRTCHVVAYRTSGLHEAIAVDAVRLWSTATKSLCQLL